MSKLGYLSGLLFISVKLSGFSFFPMHKKKNPCLLLHWLNFFSFNGRSSILPHAACSRSACIGHSFLWAYKDMKEKHCLSLFSKVSLIDKQPIWESPRHNPTILFCEYLKIFWSNVLLCWFILGDKQECFFQREVTKKTGLLSFSKYL